MGEDLLRAVSEVVDMGKEGRRRTPSPLLHEVRLSERSGPLGVGVKNVKSKGLEKVTHTE